MNKKIIVVIIVTTLLLGIGLISIPKHELPTDEEWKSYLEEIEYTRPSEEAVLRFSFCSPVQ